jgi:predicted TIM-barrel fold metal-dependent hydrolase
MKNFLCAFLVLPVLLVSGIKAQIASADPALLAEINGIKAVDNHAHPLPFYSEGEKNVESAVPDVIPPEFLPVRLRANNPEYLAAWRNLYGYKYNDFSETHVRKLLETKRRIKREKGAAYPAWVLDRLGIETMIANRTVMGRGLDAPRFRWVWNATAMMFPLSNEEAKKSNPQREADFTDDERRLKDYLAELKLARLPDKLDDYLSKFIVPILEKRKRDGAIAVKIIAAYRRTLEFADVPETEARRIYSKYSNDSSPNTAEYKALQDFLFRRIALECGRIGLAVHIHVGAGEGGWFYNSTASPFLLDSVLNDPKLKGANFVLIHGGLPNAQATRFLLDKGNVYADFSSQAFLTSTRELSGVIRSWLEFMPEKVLFGTDAYPLTTTIGWEEIGWLTTKTARLALAMALTEMMKDGEITRGRASELARMVLRENAIKLYGLKLN